jgi:hypothetical protein
MLAVGDAGVAEGVCDGGVGAAGVPQAQREIVIASTGASERGRIMSGF